MAHENNEQDEKNRKIILPIVITLAILIFAFWAYNLQNVWQSNSGSNVNLNVVKEEINESLNELEDKLEENSRLKDDASEMLNELIEEAQKSATSSEESLPATPESATTTPDFPATTTAPNINNNCPEWINCMPSIGEPRSCQIPVGCEGITQIAY